jgi:cell division protein ZapA (FtsZ GTPase activity inhibitor)
MPKSDLCLDILGTSFSITADEEPEYLEEVLAQYRNAVETTREHTGMKDPLKIAILTGYLLSDEINKLKRHTGNESDIQAEQLALDLIARIDEALGE